MGSQADHDRVLRGLTGFVVERMVDIQSNLVGRLTGPPPGGNPVDTSHSSQNWISSIARPSDSVVGSRANVVFGAPFRSLQTAIAQLRAAGRRATFPREIPPLFCSNRVEYVPFLADGSSPQSPAGWVEAAVDAASADRGRVLP